MLTDEEKFSKLFETMSLGVVYQDADGKIISANPAAERILGLTLEQMMGKASIDPLWGAIHEDGSDFPGETHPAMVSLATGQPIQNVIMGVFQPETEKYHWINIDSTPLFKKGAGTPQQVYTIFKDITELRQAQEELRVERDKFEGIISSLSDGLDIVGKDYKVHYQNKLLNDRFGDIDGKLCYEVYMARETPCEFCPMNTALATNTTQKVEMTAADGREYEITSTPYYDTEGEIKVIEVVSDITERKKMENQLRDALAEKETLLKEIHHRVKNNLTMISALISLHSDYETNEKGLQRFKALENQIHSIATIHEMLYHGDQVSKIDCKDYIRSLVDSLLYGYGLQEINVVIDVKAILLDISESIPLGLIINELTTNAFKYGLRDGEKDEFSIKMNKTNAKSYVLGVKNTGNPFPENIDFRATSSLGMQLVCIFTQQLNGTIELNRNEGTEFIITFPVKSGS
jgi:PAS domain S-box-containing protein